MVHVNGTLYWLICRNGDWKIISLDAKKGMSEESLIWARSEEWSQSEIALLAAGNNSNFFFVLRFNYIPRTSHNVWVYDKSLNKPYMTDFKVHIEGQRPIGIKNNSGEVLFQKLGYGHGAPVLVSNHRDFEFRDFSPSTRTIGRIRPFTETVVLLNDGDSSSTTNTQ